MPIYLVRWPDLSASLVRAHDEDDLIDILDQVANPDGCETSVYEGPLFIDFRLPAEWSLEDEGAGGPVTPERVVVGDVSRMMNEPIVEAMELSLAGDDGYDTGMEILRTVFPKVHAAMDKLDERDEHAASEGAAPEAERREALLGEELRREALLREALQGELVRLLQWSWRQAQLLKKTDPISELARQMDLPVALARKHAELAHGHAAPAKPMRSTSARQGIKDGDTRDHAPPAVDAERVTTTRPLFTVSNHHTDGCGEPPALDGDTAGTYFGYFANEHGEQAIYTYDYETAEATVQMGDAGWHDVHPVADGKAEGLLLTKGEATWLRACWLATGGSKDRRRG